MKKKLLIGTILLGLAITGCGAQSQTDTSTAEVADVDASEADDAAESEENSETDDETESGEASETDDTKTDATDDDAKKDDALDSSDSATDIAEIVDIKDYLMEPTAQYGGTLEEQLAEKLQTEVVVTEGEYDESITLCDGKIDVFNATNNTGYFLTYFEKVPGFEIYGLYPGMEKEKAISKLEDEKMVSDEYGNYSTDINTFYIQLEFDEKDLIKQVVFVRCYPRYFESDYEVIYEY